MNMHFDSKIFLITATLFKNIIIKLLQIILYNYAHKNEGLTEIYILTNTVTS